MVLVTHQQVVEVVVESELLEVIHRQALQVPVEMVHLQILMDQM
tara:strand:+ start:354 stop:485 length:132 start_codon:yes stop_codon:yes gene_type:complete